MTDYIIAKINLPDKEDCTFQQGFYKLKDAMARIKKLDRSLITPNQNLKTLLPRQTRRSDIKEIEIELGFKLNGLRPRHFITMTLLILVLASITMFFVDWKYALAGIVLTGILSWTSEKIGTEFKDKTIGELTERMTQRNYIQLRRDKKTINKKEVEDKIRALFLDELLLEENELNRKTILN